MYLDSTKRLNLCSFIYMIAMLILGNSSFNSNAIVNNLSMILQIFVLVILFCNFIVGKHMIYQWIFVIFGISIVMLSTFFSGTSTFLFFSLFFIGAFNIDIHSFLKNDLKIRIFMLLLIFSLFLIGVFPDMISYRGDIIRHSLGFRHPNTLGAFIFLICFEILLVNWNNLRFKHYFISISLLFLNNYINNSRSSLLTGIVIICFIFLIKTFPSFLNNSIVKKILLISPFIIISIILLIVTKEKIGPLNFDKLNLLSSGRISLYKSIYNYYGVDIFGQQLPTLSKEFAERYFLQYHILDNVYLTLLINYGIVAISLSGITIFSILSKAIKDKKYIFLVVVVCYLIFGITENTPLHPEISILWIISSIYYKGEA